MRITRGFAILNSFTKKNKEISLNMSWKRSKQLLKELHLTFFSLIRIYFHRNFMNVGK